MIKREGDNYWLPTYMKLIFLLMSSWALLELNNLPKVTAEQQSMGLLQDVLIAVKE